MKRVIFFIFLLSCGSLYAQVVKDFTLVNALNNKNVSLSDYSSSAGVILIFTSNECAFDEYYTARIKQLAQNDKVPVLLINGHRSENESLSKMKSKATAIGLAMPYLSDKEQTLITALKVSKSPEAFVLKNTGGTFSIFYRGGIDDNPQVESDVKNAYVKDAINSLLNGQNPPASTRPVGCFIRH